MSDHDEFDQAVADASSQEAVTTVREKKAFPLCPKGSHKGRCVEVKIVDREFQGEKSQAVRLAWDLEKFYEEKNDNGEIVQKPFRVFDTLSLFYGPKARLNKVFKELTNQDVRQLVTEKKFRRDGKDFIQETFQYQAFVNMTAEISVTHNPSKTDPTKIFANIAAYVCDSDAQKTNSSLVFVSDGAGK